MMFRLGGFCLVLLSLASGCDRSSPSSAPATPSATKLATQTQLTLIVPEAAEWSSEEALARLADSRDGLSAAVRLARLSGHEPLCLPAELTDMTASHLSLVRVCEELWALGLADARSERVLHAPVLLTRNGGGVMPAAGVEEELLCLYVARDPDVFPHLLISPRTVWVLQVEPQQALALERPADIGFSYCQEQGFPFVALTAGRDCDFAEVARYIWDPYELAFTGPVMDALPDPPGGKFELNLPGSPKLIPMGGEIPEPEPTPQEPPHPIRGDDLAAVGNVANQVRLDGGVQLGGALPYRGLRLTWRPYRQCRSSRSESSGAFACW